MQLDLWLLISDKNAERRLLAATGSSYHPDASKLPELVAEAIAIRLLVVRPDTNNSDDFK